MVGVGEQQQWKWTCQVCERLEETSEPPWVETVFGWRVAGHRKCVQRLKRRSTSRDAGSGRELDRRTALDAQRAGDGRQRP